MSDYTAVVTKIKVREHPNADRLQIGTVCDVDVVVGLGVREGDLGLYFSSDGQLSEEFAGANGLVEYRDPETGEKKGGYFGKNRRVKAQKFRGVDSYGFWIPINSLDFALRGKTGQLNDGTTLSSINGVPICNKYVTPATASALRGKKGLYKRANLCFAKHSDTQHLNKCISKIPVGSVIYITEKLHGTSGRTGYVLDKYTHRRTLWQAFCCGLMGQGFKRNITSKMWTTVTGTRNMILKEYTVGFYGNEEFRGHMENKVKGLLKKGEVLYYEIVGNTTTGKSIMSSVNTSGNKELKKKYGKIMDYTYGCKEKECKMYVYRITNVNDDGGAIDLSWPMVMKRCGELGVSHVPNLRPATYLALAVENMVAISAGNPASKNYRSNDAQPLLYEKDSEHLAEIVNWNVQGDSILDAGHLREGVVVRVENKEGVTAYKAKSHNFLVLEGHAKDKEDYVDMEEVS